MADDDEWEDDRDPDLDECDHENATVDILIGEFSCSCGYRRWLSGDEIRREAQLQAEMMEAYYLECTSQPSAEVKQPNHDITDADRIEFLALKLRTLAFRMQGRVDHCVERDGKDGAVTGRGVGISYPFAHDLAKTLERAADYVDARIAETPPREPGG